MIESGYTSIEGVTPAQGMMTILPGHVPLLNPIRGLVLTQSAQGQAFPVAFYRDGPLKVIKIRETVASEGDLIRGSVYPAVAAVKLSYNDGALEESFDVTDGTFETVVPAGADGMLVAQASIPIESVTDAMSASLDVRAESGQPGEPGEPGEYTLQIGFSKEPEIFNNATDFKIELFVNAPDSVSTVELFGVNPETGEEDTLDMYAFDYGRMDGKLHISGGFERPGTPYTDFVLYVTTNISDQGLSNVDVVAYEASCLSGDTLITLFDGTQKRMDELTCDDVLLSGDGTPTRIKRISRGRFSLKHTLYQFSNGAVINETHEHRFYNANQGFFQKLKNWYIGDCAASRGGERAVLIGKIELEEPAEMFGLWTESHDYWANGLLSGDAMANVKLLATATAEKAVEMVSSLPHWRLAELLAEEAPT